jgi:hypothetical protein
MGIPSHAPFADRPAERGEYVHVVAHSAAKLHASFRPTRLVAPQRWTSKEGGARTTAPRCREPPEKDDRRGATLGCGPDRFLR